MYALPAYRATIYIIGILVGYAMRTYRNVKLTRVKTLLTLTLEKNIFHVKYNFRHKYFMAGR